MRTFPLLLLSLFLPFATEAQSQCFDIFKVQKSQAQSVISGMNLSLLIKAGRDVVRSGKYTEAHQRVFESLMSLKKQDLESLSNDNLIKIFSLFANWNLLPKETFKNDLFSVLEGRLPQWKESDYFYFSYARKLTPLIPPSSFIEAYQRQVLKIFESLSTEKKMEVLGAELFHAKEENLHFISPLIKMTSSALESYVPHMIKPLKELYRGILFIRGSRFAVESSSIQALEAVLEKQVLQLGLSLTLDGTSGAINATHATSPQRQFFEIRLEDYLGTTNKIAEYSNPQRPGFYDPVDLFFPEKSFVVEWDGPHHVFRTLASSGEINTQAPVVLRPMDAMKDAILRKNGFVVLRIHRDLDFDIYFGDIESQVRQQNPGYNP